MGLYRRGVAEEIKKNLSQQAATLRDTNRVLSRSRMLRLIFFLLLGGSVCSRNFETLFPPCPFQGCRRLIGRCARRGRERVVVVIGFLFLCDSFLKGLLLQTPRKQHRGLEFTARVGAGSRTRDQSPWRGKRGEWCIGQIWVSVLLFEIGYFVQGTVLGAYLARSCFNGGLRLNVGRWLGAWQALMWYCKYLNFIYIYIYCSPFMNYCGTVRT